MARNQQDLPNVGGAEEVTPVVGANNNQGQPVESPETQVQQNAQEAVAVPADPTGQQEQGENVLDQAVARGEEVADPAEQEAYLRELGVYADPSNNGE